MKSEEFYQQINNIYVDYKVMLVTFFENYMLYTEDLCCQMSEGVARTVEQFVVYSGCTTEEAYMVQELCKWLQDTGFEKFLSVYKNMDEKHEKQIRGFIEAYSYILSLAKNDVMQLIDQLFFIPGQFKRELKI